MPKLRNSYALVPNFFIFCKAFLLFFLIFQNGEETFIKKK